MAQTRGQGAAEQDRYRITFEAVQEARRYFDEDKELEGRVGKSLRALIGARGRLSSVRSEGTVVKDEVFVHAGKGGRQEALPGAC